MTGFFNPQGFLTAMRQEVTRSHKGWALDSVICQNLVTRFAKEDIHDSPPEGVYIHGVYSLFYYKVLGVLVAQGFVIFVIRLHTNKILSTVLFL